MTRWDPTGAHNADVAVTGTPLSSIIKAGAATIKYDTANGFTRGNEVGVRFVSNAVADQANINMDEPDAVAGTAQCYGKFPKWPTTGGTASANTEFQAVRANGNAGRMIISATGVVTLQGSAGTNLGTWTGSNQLTLNQEYRFRLKCTPGTTTTNGSATAEIWNADTDALLGSVTVTGQNFNGATSTNVTSARWGDPSTTVGADFEFVGTQFEFATGTTPPDLAAVAKNTPPPVTTGRYPRIAAGGTWRAT